jgi:hypothetical protein
MTGAKSLCFTSPDKANYKYGASQFVFINATDSESSQEPIAHASGGGGSGGGNGKRYLLLSAWSAASNVTGKQDAGYSIGLQIKFADGSYSYGHKVTWPTGDHRWEKECLVIETDQVTLSHHHLYTPQRAVPSIRSRVSCWLSGGGWWWTPHRT